MNVTVTIEKGAVQSDTHIDAGAIQHTTQIEKGAIQSDTHIDPGAVAIEHHTHVDAAERTDIEITRDDQGRVSGARTA